MIEEKKYKRERMIIAKTKDYLALMLLIYIQCYAISAAIKNALVLFPKHGFEVFFTIIRSEILLMELFAVISMLPALQLSELTRNMLREN